MIKLRGFNMLEYKKYINEKNVIDISLLKDDEISFNILVKLIKNGKGIFLTNHKDFIIASSNEKHPIWIWISEEVKSFDYYKEIYNILNKEFPNLSKYSINAKMTALAIFKKLLVQDFGDNYKNPIILVAYECKNSIKPKKEVDGTFKLLDDRKYIKVVANMLKAHYKESSNIILDYSTCIDEASIKIRDRLVYGWVDNDGNLLSICVKREQENYVRIINVYTFPAIRNKGYASNLVYNMINIILESGKKPVLYADAGYVPSNTCYKNIGFEKRGLICTLEHN